MHSILALGAGHAIREADASLMPTACFHRLIAMAGVNALMAKANRTTSEDDALIAACYALTFQVACIGDGPTAFWVSDESLVCCDDREIRALSGVLSPLRPVAAGGQARVEDLNVLASDSSFACTTASDLLFS